MSAGFFRRFGSVIIDTVILLAIVSTLFSFIGGPLIRGRLDDFETLYPSFIEAQEARLDDVREAQNQRDLGLISEARYEERLVEINAFYDENYADEAALFGQYVLAIGTYYFIMLTLFNYLYHLGFKGRTLGRKLFKLQLAGKVTWWTLLMREVFWKYFYWTFTLFFGLFLDFILIGMTQSHKTIRDYLTKTRVIIEDTLYPF